MRLLLTVAFLLCLPFTGYAQSFNTGIPLPGLPKSVGPKPMSGSTSVTLATDQTSIAITGTVSSGGKVPFAQVRNVYSSVSVTANAYLQLISSTSAPTTSLDVFDSSGQTLAIAFGSAGSEVNKLYVYPGGNGVIPVAIPQSTRVSIIAINPPVVGVSATANSGELDINFYD